MVQPHHPLRILQNHGRETAPLPVRGMRPDVLDDERNPYYRLQHRRTTFDTVVTLGVESVSRSAIARVERLAWNTVARWLARAASVCRRFTDGRTTGFVATELQADEIRSFTGGKTRPTWVFAAMEVWSRLWTSTVVGRRSYRNTLALVRDVASRMTFTPYPVIVTDGFEFYGTVIRRVFDPAALYAQVIKTRRHDRVVRVDRRAVIGEPPGDLTRRSRAPRTPRRRTRRSSNG